MSFYDKESELMENNYLDISVISKVLTKDVNNLIEDKRVLNKTINDQMEAAATKKQYKYEDIGRGSC